MASRLLLICWLIELSDSLKIGSKKMLSYSYLITKLFNMFSKANIISTIVATIWGFAGGYLLWGVLADPILQDHMGAVTGVMKDPPDFIHLLIGCLIVAFAFSTIYSKWANGTFSASSGIHLGIWVGVLMGLGSGLINFATSNLMDISGTFINGAIYIVHFAVMGLLVGLIYNKTSS